ncbi:MAG: hypothetical protein ACLPX9_00360 [Rhodomicrobium sp.]
MANANRPDGEEAAQDLLKKGIQQVGEQSGLLMNLAQRHAVAIGQT